MGLWKILTKDLMPSRADLRWKELWLCLAERATAEAGSAMRTGSLSLLSVWFTPLGAENFGFAAEPPKSLRSR